MTRRRPLWGRRQWVRLALAVIGLGMFLGCSWVVLAPQLWSTSNVVAQHGIGKWIWNRLHPTRPATGSPGHYTFTFRIGGISWTILAKRLIAQAPDGSLQDIGPRDATSDYAPLWVAPDGWTGYYITGSCTETAAGLWAHTRTEIEFQTRIEPIHGGGVTLNQADLLRLFWDTVDREGRLEFPSTIASLRSHGAAAAQKIVWKGVAINVLTLLGLGMFLWCNWANGRDTWILWRRCRSGLCFECGYDIRNSAGCTVCPECGSARDTALSGA